MMGKPKLFTKNLAVGYGQRHLISNLEVSAQSGELICLMGPNGVGKSTLLRALGALQPPLVGDIWVDDKLLYKLDAKERAKLISLVLTERISLGYLTVYELISMGRYPHTNWSGKLTNADQDTVQNAMKTTGLMDLSDRLVTELSDGQLQKVLIARALSQDGSIIILDEPLIHLDVSNKWEIMNLLRNTARQHKKVLIMATHEMELSLKLADKIWLMTPNGKITTGTPEDLILNGTFNSVFDSQHGHFEAALGGFVIKGPTPDVPVSGREPANNWTKKAIARMGFNKSNLPPGVQISIENEGENVIWHLNMPDKSLACTSIEMLLDHLRHA